MKLVKNGLLFLLLISVIFIAGCTDKGQETTATTQSSIEQQQTTATSFGIGSVIEKGYLRIKLNNVTLTNSIIDKFNKKIYPKNNSIFVIVSLTIENKNSNKDYTTYYWQYTNMLDDKNNQYEFSSETYQIDNQLADHVLPNAKITGDILYEIPKNSTKSMKFVYTLDGIFDIESDFFAIWNI